LRIWSIATSRIFKAIGRVSASICNLSPNDVPGKRDEDVALLETVGADRVEAFGDVFKRADDTSRSLGFDMRPLLSRKRGVYT
jgi:hypothetical protein